ncbi:hypothetical protein BKA93DRAFT_817787 [Sparassis latifolia]|uniref:SH3 domain-containing protein n=1 Tax=Sparassis crispa TaxID=139825 RepID=A0A401GA79_9APHY|nr:hypothetical protein SCP_0202670 [Sparassis crispa]GBE79070.1 hypothetical protein SCP_0202670 [Sparassis crispa]
MASAVAQESQDIPRLSLAVEHALSTSPFPSPGSPFFPPPRLGAHEFALPPGSLMRSLATRSSQDAAALSPGIVSPDEETTPTLPKSAQFSDSPSPATPTPNTSFQINGKTTPQVTVPEEPLATTNPPSPTADQPSITSSRPAPPSPAVSRRASAAVSRRSSGAKSRRQSKVSQLLAQHEPEASSSSGATVSPATPQPKRRSLLMKIRDFAFPPVDDRHVGRGVDVPRANRPRHRSSVYSSRSSSSSSSAADLDDVEDQRGSWGSFRWNTLSTQFSWTGAPRGDDAGEDEGGPSRMDFERNFVQGSSPVDEEPEHYDYDVEDGDDEDGPLLPGLYRALFAFEPEGTAEMALEEEQLVRVVGRGGGVGWAVVEKEGGGHALVPESYLEVVERDHA